MQQRPPAKRTLPVKVNFLSDEDEGITEIPIFVTRTKEKPQKKTSVKTKKEPNDS